ncbi:UNVERIFIED_CONTAM: Glutaminyl-peptide cyclotransferase [Sesamum angustifolium]|uniref:Glutaminyl-peptide cyclotransferase n=1 Tax=Sesamum angustifolium TaxID=2727405 RepID=A0AAW2J5A5_9LAMI
MRSALGSEPNVDRIYSAEVVNRFPHDPNAFTQGLLYGGNDTLFESTGLYGHSSVRRVALQTGEVEAIHRMQNSYFGEGLTLFGDKLFQVTWLMKTGFIFGKHTVKYKGGEVHNLNELEYVNGEVWANVWQTDCIARLSSQDGVVLGWVYLPNLREELVAAGNMGIDVLNGIAWDEEQNRIFVTGKLWPKLYEIKLHPVEQPSHDDIKRLCMPPPVHFGRP